MSRNVEVITNSRMSAYRSCQRLHRLRYDDLLRPIYEDTAKRDWGTAMHEMLEIYFKDPERKMPNLATSTLDEFARASLIATMVAYEANWQEVDRAKTLYGAEIEFSLPLAHPLTKRKMRGYAMAGKVDGFFADVDGRSYLLEHKSTSQDITPGSDYWNRLRIDTQVNVYIAGMSGGAGVKEIAGVCYDVVKRTSLKPYKATPVENRKFKANGELYANQRDADETSDAYGKRVFEAIRENPSAYFARCTIVRSIEEKFEAAMDTWNTAVAIRETRKKGNDYRNPDACNKFGSMCGYFGICTGEKRADDPTQYKRADRAHTELTQITVKSRKRTNGTSRSEQIDPEDSHATAGAEDAISIAITI
jgi:hypothetical protein